MKNKIKLVMFDIDGTLLTSKDIVSEQTKLAVKKARENNILFGIATGRALDAVLDLVTKWGIDDIIDVFVGYNGSHIVDKSLNIDEHTHLLDKDVSRKIYNHYVNEDVSVCTYIKKTLHASRHDELSNRLATNNGFNEVDMDPNTMFNKDLNKLVIVVDSSKMNDIIEHEKSLDQEGYKCFKTSPILFEFVNPELSKTFGINRIASAHGWSLENVLAFGDADNDYEMLRDCGVGVCMENGSEKSKSVADYITDSNDNEGIANFINKHLL